jgi:hypothetical protein
MTLIDHLPTLPIAHLLLPLTILILLVKNIEDSALVEIVNHPWLIDILIQVVMPISWIEEVMSMLHHHMKILE